jgi:hypothetical protein
MKNNSYSCFFTRCQESKCKLTCEWENINHAIQPGCIRLEDPEPISKNNSSAGYVSSFPARVSADDWVPEVEEDDTSPLTSDSEDYDSDSDSQQLLSHTSRGKSKLKVYKSKHPKSVPKSNEPQKKCSKGSSFNSATSRNGPFTCPIHDCPLSNSKIWVSASSLHSHIREHCIGKYRGEVPLEYFRTWNK